MASLAPAGAAPAKAGGPGQSGGCDQRCASRPGETVGVPREKGKHPGKKGSATNQGGAPREKGERPESRGIGPPRVEGQGNPSRCGGFSLLVSRKDFVSGRAGQGRSHRGALRSNPSRREGVLCRASRSGPGKGIVLMRSAVFSTRLFPVPEERKAESEFGGPIRPSGGTAYLVTGDGKGLRKKGVLSFKHLA